MTRNHRLAIIAALTAIVVACSSTPQASPTPPVAGDAVERLTAQPFGQQQIDAAVEALAVSGVATFAQPDFGIATHAGDRARGAYAAIR